jgi:YidC/Oxa1 family membrane protein insertase
MDQRNLLLAVVLSLGILLVFEMFFAPKPPPPQETAEQAQTTGTPSPQGSPGAVAPPGSPATAGQAAGIDRSAALAASPRITIETPTLSGSITLKGARVDDLTLIKYRETVEPGSPKIKLLHPPGSARPYYVDFSWVSAQPGVALPTAETLWRAEGSVLSPGNPVTLTWDNGQGLRFEQTFTIDQHYMFSITQRVTNSGDGGVALSPYGLISRTGTPEILGFYILHEGLLGVFDNTLKEIDYDDLQDDGIIKQATTGGWLGITDKYWLVALVPDQPKTVETRFVHDARSGSDKYQTDFLYDALTVPAGASAEVTSRFFAGAKEVLLLDSYQEDLAIPRFDRAVDFGWFYFLTKPLFYGLHYVAQVVGNFGVAILILTIAIKLVFFPLANKSYNAMAKMRKLQPEMLRLREKYGEDKQRLNQEMMALYKKEGANPMSGCLPIVIQIPVFFALYKVLFVTIEMRHTPFFGWIHDLSAQDPTSVLNGFGLLPWNAPDLGPLQMLNIGIWPLLMGITMFLQQRLNPQPPDPVQAKIFLFMPIIFTFLLASFPAGLVIYWTWNNLLSIIQQAVIMRRAGVPFGNQPAPPTTSKT